MKKNKEHQLGIETIVVAIGKETMSLVTSKKITYIYNMNGYTNHS